MLENNLSERELQILNQEVTNEQLLVDIKNEALSYDL